MNEVKQMFPENLLALRKRAGVSQEELANVIGVSRQSISKYETGTAEPDLAHLAKLKDYFAVSYDALLGTEPAAAADAPITGSILIQSAASGQLAQFDTFKIAGNVTLRRKDAPQAQLLGVMTKNNNGFLGPDELPLGWYATRADADREVAAIQAAITSGRPLYRLQYNVAVEKRGWFGQRIVTH